MENRTINHPKLRQLWNYAEFPIIRDRRNEWAPLIAIPLLAAVMLVSSVFLLIIFRQNPTLVVTTVAACLVVITIYLTFTTVEETNETYE